MNKINILVLLLALFTITSCKSGIDIKALALPKDVLEDRSLALLKSDEGKLINDFALIKKDSTFNQPTDAERIQDEISRQKKLFINLPKDSNKKDHILKSLSAASLRSSYFTNPQWKIKTLNIPIIKRNIEQMGLDDVQAKEYFLIIADKINVYLTDSEVLLFDMSDFSDYSLSPEEFLNNLTNPRIIVLSNKNLDHYDAFLDNNEKRPFVAKGLNIGHVNKLVEAHIKRALMTTMTIDSEALKEITIAAEALAKVIGILDPFGTLGRLSDCLNFIEPIIARKGTVSEKERTVAEMIKGRVAEMKNGVIDFFKANRDFIDSLNLDGTTLANLEIALTKDANLYKEQRYKINKLLQLAGGGGSTITNNTNTTNPNVDPLDIPVTDLNSLKNNLRSFITNQNGILDGAIKERIKSALRVMLLTQAGVGFKVDNPRFGYDKLIKDYLGTITYDFHRVGANKTDTDDTIYIKNNAEGLAKFKISFDNYLRLLLAQSNSDDGSKAPNPNINFDNDKKQILEDAIDEFVNDIDTALREKSGYYRK